MKLVLETHIIQSFPVSNLNRDDTGSPKDCIIGGSRRGRISSQCIKRSIRLHPAFVKRVVAAGGDLGTRTKRLADAIADRLITKGFDSEKAISLAKASILGLGLAFDKKKPDKTEYLLFIGERELDELATFAAEPSNSAALLAASPGGSAKEPGNKKKTATELETKVKKGLVAIIGSERLERKGYAADIALFGRMIADDKDMSVDGTCQVAHAISTHCVETAFDYYTAIDDRNVDETGAGMLGIQEYNSACYYRYANVSVGELHKNLGGDKALTVAASIGFAEATAKAIPTGKQNSTAALTPPSYIRYILRKDSAPMSLAGAFSQEILPVKCAGTSIERLSIEALETQHKRLSRVYGDSDIVADIAIDIEDESGPSLNDAISQLETAIASAL